MLDSMDPARLARYAEHLAGDLPIAYAQLLDAPIRLYNGEYAASAAGIILLRQAAWTLALVLAGRVLWKSNRRRLMIQGG